MNPDTFANCLILTGPTGSGKSRIALELAEMLDAEIIAMDSMTLYRGMDIGTAKPTDQDRARVPHHLLDVLDPWQSSSVVWWLSQAAQRAQEIAARGRQVLFVGGTALYLDALLHGLFEGPGADDTVRQRLTLQAEQQGAQALHGRLQEVDPVSASRIHANNVRRVIRALEVYELTGKPISDWQTQKQGDPTPDPFPDRCLCLDIPRDELYARIDARVVKMFEDGLKEEVQRLLALPQGLGLQAQQALGYKEMMPYLEGKITREEAILEIQTRSRNFAKRQLTWFRNMSRCRLVAPELTISLWRSRMK